MKESDIMGVLDDVATQERRPPKRPSPPSSIIQGKLRWQLKKSNSASMPAIACSAVVDISPQCGQG